MPSALEFVGKPTRRWRRRVVLRAGLHALTIVGFLIVVGPVIPQLFGLRTLVVTSGSMGPEIHAGDAVLVRPRPPEEILVGDLVTFRPAGTDALKTHRVVAVERIEGRLFFRTKGDANPTPDPDLTSADAVVGTVSSRLPGVGRILIPGADPRVRVVVIGVPAIGLILKELTRWRSVRRAPSGGSARAGSRASRAGSVARSITSMIVVVVALTVLTSAERPNVTDALFGDGGDIVGNDFSTAMQFGP